jgi:uncharacterized protein (TIGR02145 family)
MTKIFLTLHCIVLAVSLSRSQTPGAGVIDIDGNQYLSVIIGSQEWMAENLRTTSYSNGDDILYVPETAPWVSLTIAAYRGYATNAENIIYGKLYNWYAVNDSRNLCPTGWHLPKDAEWNTLISHLDPFSSPASQTSPPGYKMKSTGTQYWQSPNTGATNQSGFSGLPGGDLSGTDIKRSGYWWSSSESITNEAWVRSLYYNYSVVVRTSRFKYNAYSVRCLKTVPLELIELIPQNKELVKIVDLLGRETEFKSNTLLICVYSDGTTERVFKVE